ncbi:MAG: GNAT family N-acetyltransferase [Cyanosarcina radialis HA8281-LM2]|nr:GNAT family N-acetyltransferase [Cyanosarcina radialis HA8281-LM2]
MNIRAANREEDNIIAKHFYHLWRDNDVPIESINSDWLEIVIKFIDRARQELAYKAFIAEIDGAIVGSVGCQIFDGLYPLALADSHRKYGYIWGVYVEPSYRRQGIAKKLTMQAIDRLKDLGCTRAILHASPSGKPLYSSLGFSESNEMRLDL